MAKEKFLIIAVQMPNGCFGRFDEDENCAAIDAGAADPDDAYSWIEASFEVCLVRYREATHICSFTPSAYQVWLQNFFVGIPNAAWEEDGDPDGLEYESGGEVGSYGAYRDEYDPRFVCAEFTIDTVKDLELRHPPVRKSLMRRTDKEVARLEAYHDAIWKYAEELAWEHVRNGGPDAPILDAWTYRQWQKQLRDARRSRQMEPRLFGAA